MSVLRSSLLHMSGRPLVDWALGGVGVSMATASASFAAYMIATAPAQVVGTGSKDFGIFAAFDRRGPGITTHGPSDTVRPPGDTLAAASPDAASTSPTGGTDIPDGRTDRAAAALVDMTPTGSIQVPRPVMSAPASLPEESSVALRDYRVRDVFGDHALVEHGSRTSVVRPGSVLAGAGEVLAIEKRDGGWVVRTAGGVIGGS